MRLLPFTLLFGAATLTAATGSLNIETEEDPVQENTYFNQQKVPPMLALTPENYEKEIMASKYLLVKNFSPWCHHCQAYAPIYQTIYEFYHTSHPAGSGNEDADFTKFYDFRFAALDCQAYGDLCEKLNVNSYPITHVYKDGKVVEAMKGVKTIPSLSQRLEEILEKEKPGTRPKSLELPQPGDSETPSFKAAHPLAKDPENDAPAETPSKKSEDDASEVPVKKAKSDVIVETPAKTPAKTPAETPTKAAAAAYRAPTKKAKKPTTTPNPDGKSVVLNAEKFQSKITMTQDLWFVKFYAPWCHHCQAMAPNWVQMAKEMQGKLNVGEVNCEVESRLCKDVKLKGYPTILLFKGAERVEYEGLRGLGDFVQYAEKAVDASGDILDVDEASFKALEEEEEVIFVYFYDHATASEDFLALERLPMSLIGRAKLVMTQDPALYERYKITTWPRLLVSREGRPTYYTPLTPKEMREKNHVLNWMKSVWLPIVPEVTASNAREIMDGKLVVLGILNRENQESFLASQREMKSAANEWMDKQIREFQNERQDLRNAKQLRIEEAEAKGDTRALKAAKAIKINMDRSDRREVTFAWCDGVFWQRWVRTTYGIDVKDGERVIINDEDSRRYWDQTITGNNIVPSRTSILETLNKVTTSPPKIKPKLTVSTLEKIFFDIRATFYEHPFLTMGCVIGVAIGGYSWSKNRLRRKGGHFRLDDNLTKDFKGPILGSNSNTPKVD